MRKRGETGPTTPSAPEDSIASTRRINQWETAVVVVDEGDELTDCLLDRLVSRQRDVLCGSTQ